jgi:sugar phosphate permease
MSWRYRYSVLSIILCASSLCYLDRMAMAIAIPFIAKDLRLSQLQMGEVLSAFFVGYALMQIPGGVLADRFGPRALLAASIAWWSVMTATTGAAHGLLVLLAIRVLFGLGEGPYPSAVAKALSIWFPPAEVGRANGAHQAATHLGATLAPLIAVALIVTWGWRSVFYVLAAPGLLLAALTWRYIRNSPVESRQVGSEELVELNGVRLERVLFRTSFLQSIHTPAVLWCAVCLFVTNIAGWGLANWFPTYLLQARGFAVGKMSLYTALTNLATAAGLALGGYLCDRHFGRKLSVPMIWSLAVGAAFTYLGAIATTGERTVAWIAAASLCRGVALTAMFTLPIVVMPKHSVGAAFGIVNTAGQLAGVLSPLIFGSLLELTYGNFFVLLCCMAGVMVLAVYPASRIRQLPVSQAA